MGRTQYCEHLPFISLTTFYVKSKPSLYGLQCCWHYFLDPFEYHSLCFFNRKFRISFLNQYDSFCDFGNHQQSFHHTLYILHSALKCSFGRILNATGNGVRRYIPIHNSITACKLFQKVNRVWEKGFIKLLQFAGSCQYQLKSEQLCSWDIGIEV